MRTLPLASASLALFALGAIPVPAQTLLGVRNTLDGGRQLVRLDPATGAVTAPGPIIDPPLGAGDTTVDRAGNRVFLLVVRIGETVQRLYTIDPLTGSVIANPAIAGSEVQRFACLEWDAAEGVLYGLRSAGAAGGLQVATIDPATGAVTGIGTGVSPVPGGLGLFDKGFALDPGGNRLFFLGLRLDDFAPRLFALDTTTGAATERLVDGGFGNPVSLLEWDAGEGVLYTVRDTGGGTRQLATIDPATASVAPVGVGAGTGLPVTASVGALDEAGNRFFLVGIPPFGLDAVLSTFDTTDGSLDSEATLDGSAFASYVGLEWEPTPLPVTLLGLTVE